MGGGRKLEQKVGLVLQVNLNSNVAVASETLLVKISNESNIGPAPCTPTLRRMQHTKKKLRV